MHTENNKSPSFENADPDDFPAGEIDKTEDLLPTAPEELVALDGIIKLFLQTTHIDFSHYRHKTILRRISRRISLCNKRGFAEYLAFLEASEDERESLYDDLLLSHTEFFRDPNVFDTLKAVVFPSLISQRPTKTPIRVWVAGCSSGEEVYSLAISLHEYLTETKSGVTVQFFGTDLNLRHINTARKGLYSDKIRKTVSAERLERYFDQTPEGLMVSKQIREMCVFAVQDMTQDPPFPSIDLVSCRNVLIYFDTALQEIVIPLFHFALKPTGYLLLGSSESMGKFTELFASVNQNISLYTKRFTRNKPQYRFPTTQLSWKLQAARGHRPSGVAFKAEPARPDINREIDSILLESFAPPSLVVDSAMQIRQFRGDTSPFLTPASGEASLKLSRMTSEGLMPDIYVAIEEARRKGEKIVKENITFKQQEEICSVNLIVVPVPDPISGESCFLITFQKKNAGAIEPGRPVTSDMNPDSDMHRLSIELQATKMHLQSIIEEKDEINQEMWAANEEIQSSNEEMQSVNEEMEAAKEELEASNEELISLNEELHLKNIQLNENEEKFRSTFDQSPVGSVLVGMDKRLIRCNRAFCTFLGYPEKELTGKTIADITYPDDVKIGMEEISEIAKGLIETTTVQKRYRRKDNAVVWGETSISLVRDFQGKPLYFLPVIRDITEMKRVEERLRESEYFFKESQKAASIGSYKTDFPKNRWESSEILDQIFGIDAEYVRDIPGWLALVHLEDREMMNQYVTEKVIAKGQPFNKEYRITRRSDKETRWVLGLGKVSFDPAGNVITLIGTIQDITERKETEITLQNTQKLESLGVLAGGIAHDFNNLLGGIFGYIDLAKDSPDQITAATYLEKSLATMDRARGLTGQLLTFAKGGAPIRKLTSLFPFVNETVQFALSGSNVSCHCDYPADLWSCHIDRNQVGQAIDNMAINALQAMPGGGSVDVTARNIAMEEYGHAVLQPGRYVQLSIRDYGIGISKESLPRIYDPFYTTKAKGHGLGLSTSYSIIIRHGGTIDVFSEPGKGTTFHIYLPAAAELAVEPVTVPVHHTGKGLIVVMDDEEVIRDIIGTMLGASGYTVTSAINGDEAVRIFNENHAAGRTIAGMFFDLTVPGATGGIEAVRQIRMLNSTVPVFVVSGYAHDAVMKNPADYGFSASLCKPFTRNELEEFLEKNLKGK